MLCLNSITPPAAKPAKISAKPAKLALTLCALILALHGCTSSAGLTAGRPVLPPTPPTPGAVLTDSYLCIPHNEAAELLLWIEQAEASHD